MATPLLRARWALHAAGVGAAATGLRPVPGVTSEVWYVGGFVLRVRPDPGSDRLAREALVAGLLPAEVPRPEIVGYGREEFGEWLLMRRLPGVTLAQAWPGLGRAERRAAIEGVARALRVLHAVDPLEGGWPELVEGALGDDDLADPYPLPAWRLRRVLERVRRLPGVDASVVDAASAFVDAAAGALDPPERWRVVHGDLHLENVLWCDGDVTLLDFEWCRPGPVDLDLFVVRSYCADPSALTRLGVRPLPTAELAEVAGWLAAAHPDLVASPALADRLALYRLAYDARQLAASPPVGPLASLPPHHPWVRLRRLVTELASR